MHMIQDVEGNPNMLHTEMVVLDLWHQYSIKLCYLQQNNWRWNYSKKKGGEEKA